MKLKLARPDGSVIDIEGTPEECAAFMTASASKEPQTEEAPKKSLREILEEIRDSIPKQPFPYPIVVNPPPIWVAPYVYPYPTYPPTWWGPTWISYDVISQSEIRIGDVLPCTSDSISGSVLQFNGTGSKIDWGGYSGPVASGSVLMTGREDNISYTS